MATEKKISAIPAHLLTFLLYVFMVVCGFVFGTRIWVQRLADIDILAWNELNDISSVLFALVAPGAVVLVLIFIFGLFAAGWFLLPVFMYLVGAAYGVFNCAIFWSAFTDGGLLTIIIFSLCYLCTIVAACYMCVFAHGLSRSLSGCCGGCAYIDFGKNTLCAAVVIFIADIVFAGVLYLQILSL